MPSNLATRLIRFQQIVRSSKTTYAKKSDKSETNIIPGLGIGFNGMVRLGYVIQFQTEWFPLGHSLGQIAYSVPLAPGEKTHIAIVDWSRRDVAKRTEQTSESEDLDHATYRDRSLSEAVNMLVRESQKGSSFMAGGSLSAGAGIPIGPVSLGLGIASGIGGTSSKSEGMRSLISDTTQNIGDAFHQASSVARELTSTVVVQGQQAESATAKTRVIANYNHSHALTILYYEVLQHQRLVTRATSVRPVLMLKQKIKEFSFDGEEVYVLENYRDVIAANLLDESLKPCLSVLEKRVCLQVKADYENAKVEKKPLHMLEEFSIDFITGINGPAKDVHVTIKLKNGPTVICDVVDVQLAAHHLGVTFQDAVSSIQIPPNAGTTIKFRPRNYHLRWTNVQAIEIYQGPMSYDNYPSVHPYDWDLKEIHVKTVNANDTWNMYDSSNHIKISYLGQPVRFEVVPYEEVVTFDPEEHLSEEERCCLNRLLRHLNTHGAHYWRAIWLAEIESDRAIRLDSWKINNLNLFDIVENRVLDVVGDEIVMPMTTAAMDVKEIELFERAFGGSKGLLQAPILNEYVEQLLTIPARGVFAEAKLGHCNASEIIDPSRFWDWQNSPIPDSPPAILPTSTGDKAQDITKETVPTPFPANLVNIVNPQGLPDPTGLSVAGGVLSSLGPFRDMSGIKELGTYLQNLSNNANQLAGQGLKNAQTAGLMNTIRSAKELTPEQRAILMSELLTGQVKMANAPPTASGIVPTPSTPTPSTPTPSTPTPSTPTPSAPTPVPPAPKENQKKQAERASETSPNNKKVNFMFQFDTNDVMLGEWEVTLISDETVLENKGKVINDLNKVSGVKVGNRVSMLVPKGFGVKDDVLVHINAVSMGIPEVLSSTEAKWKVQSWKYPRTFQAVIPRDKFAKTLTFKVIQETETITITTTQSKTEASRVHVNGDTKGIDVQPELDLGNKFIGEFKITAKGTYGWKSEDTDTESNNSESKQVVFTARRMKDTAPTITPLL
ncbi:hypothetical protein [Bacillus cereus group sp. RP43]|uniref:hypothetical protein n=1 Tax=Bacillus cereus group sp. RP43 TaxID=3040260 RepID=UPI00339B71B3